MNILCHRGLWKSKDERNTINSLVNAHNEGFGVELDLRDRGSQIVISHDFPNDKSELFDSYLNELKANNYKNNTTLAINIKADGLTSKIQKIINNYENENNTQCTIKLETEELNKDDMIDQALEEIDAMKEFIMEHRDDDDINLNNIGMGGIKSDLDGTGDYE